MRMFATHAANLPTSIKAIARAVQFQGTPSEQWQCDKICDELSAYGPSGRILFIFTFFNELRRKDEFPDGILDRREFYLNGFNTPHVQDHLKLMRERWDRVAATMKRYGLKEARAVWINDEPAFHTQADFREFIRPLLLDPATRAQLAKGIADIHPDSLHNYQWTMPWQTDIDVNSAGLVKEELKVLSEEVRNDAKWTTPALADKLYELYAKIRMPDGVNYFLSTLAHDNWIQREYAKAERWVLESVLKQLHCPLVNSGGGFIAGPLGFSCYDYNCWPVCDAAAPGSPQCNIVAGGAATRHGVTPPPGMNMEHFCKWISFIAICNLLRAGVAAGEPSWPCVTDHNWQGQLVSPWHVGRVLTAGASLGCKESVFFNPYGPHGATAMVQSLQQANGDSKGVIVTPEMLKPIPYTATEINHGKVTTTRDEFVSRLVAA